MNEFSRKKHPSKHHKITRKSWFVINVHSNWMKTTIIFLSLIVSMISNSNSKHYRYRQYSMGLQKLVSMLLLKQETEDKCMWSYLSISAHCKTQSPQPKPNRASIRLINRLEEIALPAVVPLAANVSCLNRKVDNKVLQSFLEQIDMLTLTFLYMDK